VGDLVAGELATETVRRVLDGFPDHVSVSNTCSTNVQGPNPICGRVGSPKLRPAGSHVEQPPTEPHLLSLPAALVTGVVRVAIESALLFRLTAAL
jgi:hypothetical protein